MNRKEFISFSIGALTLLGCKKMGIGTGIGAGRSGSLPIPIQSEFTTWYAAVVANGGTLTAAQQGYYNETIYYLKLYGQWSELDCLQVDIAPSSNVAVVDLILPSRKAVNTGCTFTAYQGWAGVLNSSTAILNRKFNPGDGGTYNYIQNDASYGWLCLTNTFSASSHAHVCGGAAGFTPVNAYIHDGGNGYVQPSIYHINSNTAAGSTVQNPIVYNNAWHTIMRTSSSATSRYMNGVKFSDRTLTSAAVANCDFVSFNDFLNGVTIGAYGVAEKQGAFFAGSSSISPAIIQAIITKYLIKPMAASALAQTKRVIFEGDSFSGYVLGTTLSQSSEYPRETIRLLGDGWCMSSVSQGGETAAQMLTQYPTEVRPYRCQYFEKDIFVLEAGLNDLATRSGALVYADIAATGAMAHTDGFKTVIVGCPTIYLAGLQATFDTNRAALRTLMLADFTVPLGTNLWGPAPGVTYADVYFDTYGDVRFQDFNDATYYQAADKVHLTTAGYDIYGSYVSTAINLL